MKLSLLSEQGSFFKSHIAQNNAVHKEAWRRAAAVYPVDITCVSTHRADHNTFCKGPALPDLAPAKDLSRFFAGSPNGLPSRTRTGTHTPLPHMDSCQDLAPRSDQSLWTRGAEIRLLPAVPVWGSRGPQSNEETGCPCLTLDLTATRNTDLSFLHHTRWSELHLG